MEWMAFSALVLGTFYFVIHYRGFRRTLTFTILGVVVLAVVGGIVSYLFDQQAQQRRQVASLLIKPNQIEIADAKLSIGISAELKAVVTNKSPYDLAELALMVTVMDCPGNAFYESAPPPPSGYVLEKQGEQSSEKNSVKCNAVGEYVARDYGINIPKGQKRAFEGYVHFYNLPPLKPNEWSWHYSIVEIVAVRD